MSEELPIASPPPCEPTTVEKLLNELSNLSEPLKRKQKQGMVAIRLLKVKKETEMLLSAYEDVVICLNETDQHMFKQMISCVNYFNKRLSR